LLCRSFGDPDETAKEGKTGKIIKLITWPWPRLLYVSSASICHGPPRQLWSI